MNIIGLDFGNFNSYPSYIHHFDPDTRIGGDLRDLIPPGKEYRNGIPSVYFVAPGQAPRVGVLALRSTCVPYQNRKRFLKRHMGQTADIVDMNGNKVSTISNDEAITAVIEHCVRVANNSMMKNFHMTTNLISLAYPGSFTSGQRQHLIDLAEKGTLEDGTPIKVFGTIAEPAAAALDYLSDEATEKQKDCTTVLTYDLGGGTFDLGLVATYPKGRKTPAGKTYYYDILATDGLSKVGGLEFDKVVYQILRSQINVPMKASLEGRLRAEAVEVKELLSESLGEEELLFDVGNDSFNLTISVEEFEKKSHDLLQKTIDRTRDFLNSHKNQRPDIILLAGGASQMPMVKKALEEAFPEYKGKVESLRPTMAISYGAARYGTVESQSPIVNKRLSYDIGIQYYRDENDPDGFVEVIAKAGTELPCNGYSIGRTLKPDQESSNKRIFEARKPDACAENMEDWVGIMNVVVEFGRKMPKGSRSKLDLSIDEVGHITLIAQDLSKPDQPLFKSTYTLDNLS